MDVRVRTFDAATDMSGLRRLFIELQDRTEIVDEQVQLMLERCATTCGHVIVAELEGSVVGFASLLNVDGPEPDVEVAELSVLAEARAAGVGGALLAEAERCARAKGAPSLRVRVDVDDLGTRRMYDRRGFQPRSMVLVKRLATESAALAPARAAAAPPWSGGCVCTAFRYEITQRPRWVGYCHCSICRRASGAPVVAWATVPQAAFVRTAGELRSYASSEKARRGFCASCGTQVTFELLSGGDIDVTLASMDDPAALSPEFHIWTSSRVPWFDTTDPLPRFEEEIVRASESRRRSQ